MEEDQIHDYRIIKLLGSGSFGHVYLAQNPKKNKYALKSIPITPDQIQFVRKQAKIAVQMQHSNIIQTRQFFLYNQEKKLAIIMEYCPTNLQTKIGQLTQNQKIKFVIELVEAIKYLHNQKHIIHRDLKPTNILISQSNSLKVSDFGISKQIKGTLGHTNVGSPWYMAPQIGQQDHYQYSVDIWALGLIFWEIFANKESIKELKGRRVPADRQDFPTKQFLQVINDDQIIQIVAKMLVKNPKQRPTIDQVSFLLNNKSNKPEIIKKKQNISKHYSIKNVEGPVEINKDNIGLKDKSILKCQWYQDAAQKVSEIKFPIETLTIYLTVS